MPTKDVAQFVPQSNAVVLDALRGAMSNEYQRRVPAATKASVNDALNAMWGYVPARNEFVDALVNVIGSPIVRYNTWNNPLGKFKQGELTYGETIEEVAIGLLTAKKYEAGRQELEGSIFGRDPNNVQSRFHKVNRQDYYKVSVPRDGLRRAFYSNTGLSQFVSGLMASVNTSDNWDEFLLMSSLFREYYDRGGFYSVNVPDIANLKSDVNDAKQFLRVTRSLADTLPFISERYNAAHMPTAVQPADLELFITPEANAAIDVEALAAAFNIDKSQIGSRTTVIPQEQFNIPGAQGILTSRDFFVVGDNLLEMQNSNNPVMLHQNYFWHHWEIISASAFVPAILLTTENGTETIVVTSDITGISDITLSDETDTAVTNATVTRGEAYEIDASAVTSPDNADYAAVVLTVSGNKSGRTRVTQTGLLVIGYDEPATQITVTATSVVDGSFTKDLVLTVTGDLVTGSIASSIDEDPATFSNTALPGITPASGPVGTVFTADNGRWDQRVTGAYQYQWNLDGTPITGATSKSYTAVAGDANHSLSVVVTATSSGQTATATSPTATVTA